MMILKVESLSILSSWSDKSFNHAGPDATAISMKVAPLARDHIELSTGEVFRHPRKNFGNDDKPNIAATAYIIAATGAARKSAMRYFEGRNSDEGDEAASIHFDLAISPEAFAEAITNIRSGVFPTRLIVDFDMPIFEDKGPLEYGWQPDGSGLKWDNSTREKQDVRIRAVQFVADILQPVPAPDSVEAADFVERPVFVQSPGASPDENSKALLAAVGDINTNLKRLTKVLIVIVATALGVSYKFW